MNGQDYQGQRGHYIMIKGQILEEHIKLLTCINLTIEEKNMRQKLIDLEIENSTIVYWGTGQIQHVQNQYEHSWTEQHYQSTGYN